MYAYKYMYTYTYICTYTFIYLCVNIHIYMYRPASIPVAQVPSHKYMGWLWLVRSIKS